VSDSTAVLASRYKVREETDYQWHQTAQIRAPFKKDEGLFRALLEDLIRVAQHDSVRVRRRPGDSRSVTMAELQEGLDADEGIDVSSATHVRIDYEWGRARLQFQREIAAIQFVYRRSGWWDDTNVSVLYLETDSHPWLLRVLRDNGYVPPRAHPVPVDAHPVFIHQLTFPQLKVRSDVVILQIGNQPAPEIDEEEKEQLVQKVMRRRQNSRR
jgi:hypothetical protein